MLHLPLSIVIFAASAFSHSAQYDYVIVGGGTGGLVPANRLTEDPHVTVAVIEAGGSVLNNSLVTSIFGNCYPCGTAVDWNYTTVPQKFANYTTGIYHAGKCLGGSSAINGMVYLRPSEAELDSWPALGNPGWTWNSTFPYYKRSEHLQLPTPEQEEYHPSFESDAHGFDGPLLTGWWAGINTTGFGPLLNASWLNQSLSWNQEPNGGDLRGLFLHPSEYNVATSTREDAARAYYWPIAGRANLHTYTFTTAVRVNLQERHGLQSATGVEVVLPNGQKQNITARREVIISTGTYRTPGLLESSGIGNPSQLNDPVKIDLPGVGRNMQDQWGGVLVFNTTISTSLDILVAGMPFVATVTAADLFGGNLSAVASSVRSSIPAYASLLVENGGHTSIEAATALLTHRADLIFSANAPIGELLFEPLFAAFYSTLPFSSGSVHGASPVIDGNVMAVDFDVQVTAALGRLARRVYAGLASVSSEIVPGPQVQTDEQWKSFFDASWTPVWHAVGTAAMMGRELGGVVDDRMVVYGTSNLRVVSAAAIPFELNGHPTATIYAMAEKVSDLIRQRWN